MHKLARQLCTYLHDPERWLGVHIDEGMLLLVPQHCHVAFDTATIQAGLC